jgi:hypothetical protein
MILLPFMHGQSTGNESELRSDGYPTFKVQDYTVNDIERHVCIGLRLGPKMIQGDRLTRIHSSIQCIVNEAKDVFLWVILVVQDIPNRRIHGEALMGIKDDINQLFRDVISLKVLPAHLSQNSEHKASNIRAP